MYYCNCIFCHFLILRRQCVFFKVFLPISNIKWGWTHQMPFFNKANKFLWDDTALVKFYYADAQHQSSPLQSHWSYSVLHKTIVNPWWWKLDIHKHLLINQTDFTNLDIPSPIFLAIKQPFIYKVKNVLFLAFRINLIQILRDNIKKYIIKCWSTCLKVGHHCNYRWYSTIRC